MENTIKVLKDVLAQETKLYQKARVTDPEWEAGINAIHTVIALLEEQCEREEAITFINGIS